MNRIELSDRIAGMWRKSRYDAGKSQEYVARALGVSKKTIQNWEAGEASPNFRVALEWFDALGVPMYPYLMSVIYPTEIETLDRFLDTAKEAVRNGKESYTIIKGETTCEE